MIESVKESNDPVEYDKYKYKALKVAGMEEKFKEFAELRVGETLDKDLMEQLLLKVAAGVADE